MILKSMLFWSVALFCVTVVSSVDYFCQNDATQTITGKSTGMIKTRETQDGFSGNNLLCSWVIDAGPGARVQLTIDSLDLQWSPTYATCTDYDNLQIREGDSVSGYYLASVCHAKNPYNVVSRGSKLFLQMSTTQQDFAEHRGVELTFETFSNTSCPPGWFQASDDADTCLMVGSRGRVIWEDSQDVCEFSLANMASIVSQEEYQAVLAHGQNNSVDLAWIGLSDLAVQRSFKWVDKKPFQFQREITDYGFRTNCVAQDFSSGNWKAQECDETLHYICKANKDGSTVFYPAIPPSKPPEDGPGGSKLFLVVIIIVVVAVLGGIGIIIALCYCRRNEKCCWKPPLSYRDGSYDDVNYTPATLQPSGAPPAYHEALKLDKLPR